MAINVWNDIQKITIKLAEVLYRKLKNNIVLQKNQVDKYRKKFPKFIPNKGLILPNIDSIGKVIICIVLAIISLLSLPGVI